MNDSSPGAQGPQFQPAWTPPSPPTESDAAQTAPPGGSPPAARRGFLRSRTFAALIAGVLGLAVGAAGGGAGAEAEPVPIETHTVSTTQLATVSSTVTATAVSTATTTQTVTVTAPAPTEPAVTVVPGEYRALEERDFKLIAKDPDKFSGDQITIYGEVTQFDSATGSTTLRADTGGSKKQVEYGFTDYDQNAMLTGSEALLEDIVQGDVFEAQVVVTGSFSYDTQIGGSTTVPLFEIVAISAYDSTD